jgi:hypothetical protein
MTLFLCGLFVGLAVGSIAATLAHIYWTFPAVIERAYRDDWLKPGPVVLARAAKQHELQA